MARKFIEFLEAAALIILTGIIVVGVYKYVDSKEEPKEEDPIVDTDQENKIIEVRLNSSGPSFKVDPSSKMKCYDGITWEKFMELNSDSILTDNSFDEEGYLRFASGYWYSDSDATYRINKIDLVQLDFDGLNYVVSIYYNS